MYKFSFIDLFVTLNSAEFKYFGKFVRSPIHNSNSNLIKIYDLLKKTYPDFKFFKNEPQQIYKKLFPYKSYNEGILRNLNVDMTNVFERFLIFLEQKEDKFTESRYLLNQLMKRKLFRLFEKNLENGYNCLDQSQYIDEDYYLNKFLLESIRREYLEFQTPISKFNKLYEGYSNEVDNIIKFFIILMLKEYLHIHNREGNTNYQADYKFFNEILNYTEKRKNTFLNERLINLLIYFLKIYDEKYDENLYPQLKDLLNQNKSYIKKDVYDFLSIDLYNYCKDQEELGRKDYGFESFKLLEDMLKNEVFNNADGYISAHTFISIAGSAMREKELDWSKHFIDTYINKVQPEDRDNAHQYILGTYYYILGEKQSNKKEHFNLSLEHLSKVKVDYYAYMSQVKSKQICIFYDFDDFDNALNILDSYKHYLKNNKSIPKDYKERSYNFVKTLTKLINIRLGSKSYTPQELRKEVINYKTMDLKKWTLEKLAELEKKN